MRNSADIREKVRLVTREIVEIVPYDAQWPQVFAEEVRHLAECVPPGLIRRVEHFGSTAVPGLAAKPVVDMLVEVRSLRAAREKIAPILEAQRYDYLWRPTFGDDVPPWYAFFIKRNADGVRTHHLHLITRRSAFQPHWDRLLFRDYLIAHPETAREYERVKRTLAAQHREDREAYTEGKSAFIGSVMAEATRGRSGDQRPLRTKRCGDTVPPLVCSERNSHA
jgi:GrpB-like predicted nucleotidyltransferase (UPF0157 family)